MCRVRVTQFLACGHRGQYEREHCGKINCQPCPEQEQVDQRNLCPECQRRQSPSSVSHGDSTSSRLSTQNLAQRMPGSRRMSVNPRDNLRIQLEDLARQHSQSTNSTTSAAFSPARVPVEYPPPPPNLRKQDLSRETHVAPIEPSTPHTPRSRRRSTRSAAWIGSPPHGNPLVPSPPNTQFMSQYPAMVMPQPQQTSLSSSQQRNFMPSCTTNDGNPTETEKNNPNVTQRPRKTFGHTPHVSSGDSRFYHDPSIW